MKTFKYLFKIKYLVAFFLVLLLTALSFGIAVIASTDGCTCGTESSVHLTSCELYTKTARPTSSAAIKVSLFSTASHVPGTGVTLTEEGLDDYVWSHDTMRYLHVELTGLGTGLAEGEYYQLVIIADPAVYFPNILPHSDWASSYSVEENPGVPMNGFTYSTAAGKSAVITYNVAAGSQTATASLAVGYDWILWDGVKESRLGYNAGYTDLIDTSLLRVELRKVSSDLSFFVNSASLDCAYTDITDSILTGSSLYVSANGVTFHQLSEFNSKSYIRYSINTDSKHLRKSYKFTVELPHFVVGGNVYPMRFDFSKFSFKVYSGTGILDDKTLTPEEYTITDESDATVSRITIEFKNFCKIDSGFSIYALPPLGLDDIASTISSTGGKVTTYIDDTLSKRFNLVTAKMIPSDVKISIRTNAASASIYDNSVKTLGTLSFSNTGGTDSGNITVSYVFDTEKIGVTTVRIPMPSGSTATVYYTLVKSGADPIRGSKKVTYSASASHISGALFASTTLADWEEGYYFESISYCLETVPAGAILYHASALSRNGGSIWGRILIDYIPSSSERPISYIKLYSGDFANSIEQDEDIAVEPIASGSVATTINMDKRAPYGINSLTVSTDSITAGQSFTVTARAFMYDYPYTGKTSFNKIRMGLLLPEGAIIPGAESVSARLNVKRDGKYVNVDIVSLSMRTVNVGGESWGFWIIEADPNVTIGYYNENLKALPEGSEMYFTIPVQTEFTVAQQTLNLVDLTFVAGFEQSNGSSGSAKNYATDDLYDLVGNGASGNKAGKSDKVSVNISIEPPSATLEITDQLRSAGGSFGTSLAINDISEKLTYTLTVNCTRGGTARDFFYYIPIPKVKSSSLDFVNNDCEVTMELAGIPTLVAPDGSRMRVYYTYDEDLTYENAKDANWYLFDALSKAAPVLENITMLKMEPDDGYYLENGSSYTLTVVYGLSDDVDFIGCAGASVEWSSKGYYEYIFGTTTNAGDRTTEGSTITLNFTAEMCTVTLTAAKDRLPSSGSVKQTLDLFDILDISKFKLDHKFTLSNVVAYSVDLVDYTEEQFLLLNSTDSNKSFRVTSSFLGSAERAILKNQSFDIGTVTSASSSANLTLELYNGNSITENASARSIRFDLVSDSGLTIPFTVIIKRELTPATPSDPSIIAGKSYSLWQDVNSSVRVHSDAAVSAQYVASFYPSNYRCPTVLLSGADGWSGKVIMIDWSDSDHPKYYYATVTAGVALSIEAFVLMSDNSTHYVYPTGEVEIKQSLVFIIDLSFDDCTGVDASISLSRKSNSDNTVLSQELSFETETDSRSFEAEISDNIVTVGAPFTLSYSTSSQLSSDADYLYKNRALSLVISSRDMPSDGYITVDSVKYYRNSLGDFVVPITNDLQSLGSKVMTVSAHSSLFSTRFTLSVSLYAAMTDNAALPYSGTVINEPITLGVVSSAEPPALSVESFSQTILRDELSGAFELRLNGINTDNLQITLEAQQKIDLGYTTLATVINTVDGAQGNNGVFSIRITENGSKITFNRGISSDTYRLLLKIYYPDGTVLGEVTYTFVVI